MDFRGVVEAMVIVQADTIPLSQILSEKGYKRLAPNDPVEVNLKATDDGWE